jgi:hypothetical protein
MLTACFAYISAEKTFVVDAVGEAVSWFEKEGGVEVEWSVSCCTVTCGEFDVDLSLLGRDIFL